MLVRPVLSKACPYIGNVKYPETVSRLSIFQVLFRFIILRPQVFIILPWFCLLPFLLPVMWIIALFKAKYPEKVYNFCLGVWMKEYQGQLYLFCLTNTYPRFVFSGKEFMKTKDGKPLMEPPFYGRHPFIGNAQNPQRVSRLIILEVLFVRPIIIIPLLIIHMVWAGLRFMALSIMWITALFTKKFPKKLYYFSFGNIQKEIQLYLYLCGLSQIYPEFAFSKNNIEHR